MTQKVYVYWSNLAENGLNEYDSIEEAQKDKDVWDNRHTIIIGEEYL